MMIKYKFEVIEVKPLKGHKIEGSKDYRIKVLITKAENVVFDGVIVVRKNLEGVFPDTDGIKLVPASLRKEVTKELKEYVKKIKK